MSLLNEHRRRSGVGGPVRLSARRPSPRRLVSGPTGIPVKNRTPRRNIPLTRAQTDSSRATDAPVRLGIDLAELRVAAPRPRRKNERWTDGNGLDGGRSQPRCFAIAFRGCRPQRRSADLGGRVHSVSEQVRWGADRGPLDGRPRAGGAGDRQACRHDIAGVTSGSDRRGRRRLRADSWIRLRQADGHHARHREIHAGRAAFSRAIAAGNLPSVSGSLPAIVAYAQANGFPDAKVVKDDSIDFGDGHGAIDVITSVGGPDANWWFNNQPEQITDPAAVRRTS